MEIYKVNDNPEKIFSNCSEISGRNIVKFNEISTFEYELLHMDLDKPIEITDLVFAEFEDGDGEYLLKKDIITETLYTKQDVVNYSLDVLKFLTDHDDIGFNKMLNKWDTNYGIGYQSNEELLRIFEANKSKLSVSQYGELIQSLREQTFHMTPDQAKFLVDSFIMVHPDMLKYKDIEWYYKFLLIMTSDKELLQIYMSGFVNELDGNQTPNPYRLKERAYMLGQLDAIIGDDIRGSDLQTDEEILKKIKE